MKKATAFAPATVANVAVGFDILGFAVDSIGETAILEKREGTREVEIMPVEGFPQLSKDPAKNTAGAGLLQLIKDKNLSFGFRVQLKKTIPVGSGLGGSATSAVAAIVAANALLKNKLSKKELLYYALIGEAVASEARHADNVGPCLEGGLCLISGETDFRIIKIPTPQQLRIVILLPNSTIKTSESRKLLAPQVAMKAFVQQTQSLAGFLMGCQMNDYRLIGESLKDHIIEPQRASMIAGFYELQTVARQKGALGFSISGSGPALFAMVRGPAAAKQVQAALLAQAKKLGIEIQGTWISKIANTGAHTVKK